MLTRYLHANNTREYVDVSPDVENNLNSRRHRIIGMAPNEVTAENESEVYAKSVASAKSPKTKFKVGDRVRISRIKQFGEKAHRGGWTMEIYKIAKINLKNPITSYGLEDLYDEEIKGKFYGEELQKVDEPEFYRIDKVLKTKTVGRRKRYLVTFVGYSKPAWVDDLKRIKK